MNLQFMIVIYTRFARQSYYIICHIFRNGFQNRNPISRKDLKLFFALRGLLLLITDQHCLHSLSVQIQHTRECKSVCAIISCTTDDQKLVAFRA